MGEREMVEKLLEFDRAKLRRDDIVVSWKELAFEVGVSPSSLQTRCRDLGVTLPRWGPADKSPVFLPRGKIMILKALYFA